MKKQTQTVKLHKTLTPDDLEAVGNLVSGLMDKQSAVLRQDLAGKKDLHEEIAGVEKRLKEYMSEGFESVMQGMDVMADKLADKEKLERIVEWAIMAGAKIGVRPKL